MVARLPNSRNATHNLVLNKYPVIPRHSILSTIGFKRQTDFLEGQDLDVIYSCLQAWEAESTTRSPSRLFAFFNSGDHSGASQPHRHIQLLPIKDMMNPQSPGTEWQPLIDLITEQLPDYPEILRNFSLPFCHYAMNIPEDPGPEQLKWIYHHLYEIASKSVHCGDEGRSLVEHIAVDSNRGDASISYNLAMTSRAMAICPRSSENATVPTTSGQGSVAVNGTILGGTLMVKERSEWEAFRQSRIVIDDVLAEIGIPLVSDAADLSTRL